MNSYVIILPVKVTVFLKIPLEFWFLGNVIVPNVNIITARKFGMQSAMKKAEILFLRRKGRIRTNQKNPTIKIPINK